MIFKRLRKIGLWDNHKRVYRIYTEMKLNIRRKHKKRLPARVRVPLLQPLHYNLTWSMDFVHDGLFRGKPFRAFNVIDDFNREVLTISIDTSLTSLRVIRELDKLLEWRGICEIFPMNCLHAALIRFSSTLDASPTSGQSLSEWTMALSS